MIISDGYNGTPSGFENCCEDEEEGLTRWDVLHAEANAILKVARSQSCEEQRYISHFRLVKNAAN
jgi:dCMP deaminase